MRARRLAWLLTLGLVAGALAGVVVPAGAQETGPENPGQNAIFFPSIPNGVDIEEGNGPWYGVITVQNLEDPPVDLEIISAGGETVRTASLNAHASRTFAAASLGIEDEAAGAVYVTARFQSIGAAIDAGLCEVSTFTVTRAADDPNGSDEFDTGLDRIDRARVDGFVLGTDYTVSIDGGVVTIDWGRAGAEPDGGTTYTLRVWVCPPPRIGGVEKHASVDLSSAGRTSSDTVAVTGYTAIPLSDLALSRGLEADAALDDVLGETGQGNWAFPIVQTNNGWNSVIHVTNFSDVDSCGVTVTFYESPSGASDASFGEFSATLDAGEMVDIDLLAEGFPTGVNEWVGQAWVSADCAVAATVDRLKDETDMALTLIPQPRVDTGDYATYGPLVYENFSGWNTGITFANLSDTQPNTVTISFYNQNGQLVSSDQRVLQPRAVEYIYRPATANQELGGPVGSLQQVVVEGTAPLAAAADSVKYLSGREEGQALSYLLQGGAFQGETLSVALIQKGTSLAPSGQFSGDTSGVQLFNASSTGPATVEYTFYEQSGAPVAPTLTGPVATTIGALGAATLYTPFFAEMPGGFQGSFVATVVDGGPVAAVSNNVNYDVVGDGTAAYNAFLAGALEVEPTRFEAVPESESNPVTVGLDNEGNPIFNTHTVTVTVSDQFGDPLPGVDVCVDVVSGPNAGESDCGVSGPDGTFSFTYTSNGELGTDAIRVWVDLDADGVVDDGETDTLIKEWVLGEARVLDCTPEEATNNVDDEHEITCTLTDGAGNPVAGATILANVDPGANSDATVTCSDTDVNGQASCSYTGENAGNDTITVWHDADGQNDLDATEAFDQVSKTWVDWAIKLTPEAAQNLVAFDHTVTATVTDNVTNNPVSGATVLFEVTGTNPTSGSGLTGANGQVDFTYTGTYVGNDTITACVDVNGNDTCDDGEPTATATKMWTQPGGPPIPNPGAGGGPG